MNGIFSSKVIKAGLFVGTLDILAACLQFYLKTNKGPAPIFKYISSGVFGEKAFTDGNTMIVWGLVFHYVIALIFTLFFFLICKKFPKILIFKFLTGILYGIFIWSVMNFVVLPISKIPKNPFNFTDAVIAIMILIACIGIPLTFMASKQINPKK
jgi:hypothetical protein